jgi:hypothetical protein
MKKPVVKDDLCPAPLFERLRNRQLYENLVRWNCMPAPGMQPSGDGYPGNGQ